MRKLLLGLVTAAVALALAQPNPADAGGGRYNAGPAGGSIPKPTITGPGTKPGWSGGGTYPGRGWHGSGRHHYGRGWYGHYPGYRPYYYPYYPWAVGLGLTFAWPWWGYAGYYPYYGTYYPYYMEYPVGEVRENLDPEPMPYRPPKWAQSFRFYCPPTAAYYPDVRTCSQSWLKVLPQDAGPAAPPAEPNAPLPEAPVPTQ